MSPWFSQILLCPPPSFWDYRYLTTRFCFLTCVMRDYMQILMLWDEPFADWVMAPAAAVILSILSGLHGLKEVSGLKPVWQSLPWRHQACSCALFSPATSFPHSHLFSCLKSQPSCPSSPLTSTSFEFITHTHTTLNQFNEAWHRIPKCVCLSSYLGEYTPRGKASFPVSVF